MGLSLKNRLTVVSTLLMVLAIGFAGIHMYRLHQRWMDGSSKMARAYNSMSAGIQARISLAEIGRQTHLGTDYPLTEIDHFHSLMKTMEPMSYSFEYKNLLDSVAKRFAIYENLLKLHSKVGSRPSDLNTVESRYEEVSAALSSFIEMNDRYVHSLAASFRTNQASAFKLAWALLFCFIAMVVLLSFRVISAITRPAWILERLRGYRNLNVKRLLIEKRRAEIIAASISDGIFLLRGDEVIYLNPTAEKILGIEPDASTIYNDLDSDIRGDGHASAHDGSVNDVYANDVYNDKKIFNLKNMPPHLNREGGLCVMKAVSQSLPVEYALTLKEGKFHYLISSFPISYEQVEQMEYPAGKMAEQKLDKFRADILVLAQNVTVVKESQEAKSHFLGTLSHEIKTPVTSLTMGIRLLRKMIDQIPNPTHRTLIETCSENVDRLRILLEDLMSVSKFDTLAQGLKIQKVDLGKLLRHSVQSFQTESTERGIELVQKVLNHGRAFVIPIDATKITWALSNLIINALRHTPRGGRVEVRLEVIEDQAQVCVIDSGPGIERSRQMKIFDKFNPYYDLRVARSGTVGAGLAIAREIVTAHGGRIWVESEPGNGARFCFTLPLSRLMVKPGVSGTGIPGPGIPGIEEKGANRSVSNFMGGQINDKSQGIF